MSIRGSMHEARKRRIWEAHGRCCYICGEPVPMTGPFVRYDHKWQLAMDGPEADENVGPSHTEACDKVKTKKDAGIRAKVKRLAAGPKEPKRKIQSRGFRKDGPKQKIASRGFAKRKRLPDIS